MPGCPAQRGCSPMFIIVGQSPWWGPLQDAAPLSVGELGSLKIQKVCQANSIPKWPLNYRRAGKSVAHINVTETAMCPPELVGLRTASKVLLPAGAVNALRTSILGSPRHQVCPEAQGCSEDPRLAPPPPLLHAHRGTELVGSEADAQTESSEEMGRTQMSGHLAELAQPFRRCPERWGGGD